ncbi:hypothetical protein ON010_g10566 [Phytophthora cinnamomi]|nr:hypothetical protein ON010_g10566 [Phytophthora cinnamomi]
MQMQTQMQTQMQMQITGTTASQPVKQEQAQVPVATSTSAATSIWSGAAAASAALSVASPLSVSSPIATGFGSAFPTLLSPLRLSQRGAMVPLPMPVTLPSPKALFPGVERCGAGLERAVPRTDAAEPPVRLDGVTWPAAHGLRVFVLQQQLWQCGGHGECLERQEAVGGQVPSGDLETAGDARAGAQQLGRPVPGLRGDAQPQDGQQFHEFLDERDRRRRQRPTVVGVPHGLREPQPMQLPGPAEAVVGPHWFGGGRQVRRRLLHQPCVGSGIINSV